MSPILEINSISKRFYLDHQRSGYLSLRERLMGAFNRSEAKEEFWALKDVSFTVNPGDAVGIIGRNGAGKSTLLKILSRITPPTSGKILVRGRIASLLEVGTGFHMELTGRENVFMNGSILGMKRADIRRQFDAIVDFSGTEKFLDTPLKHYSSGMQLRLAFAVAAHLDPEILVVDEVLAVGDAEFQKKCLSKMEDVSGQGRTVLFVSHNLPTLKAICKTGVLLKEGRVTAQGNIDSVIDTYTSYKIHQGSMTAAIHYFQPHLKVHEVIVNGQSSLSVTLNESALRINLKVEFYKRMAFELDVHIKKNEQAVASYANFVSNEAGTFEPGMYEFAYEIQLPEMRSGKYGLDLFFTEPFVSWYCILENQIDLEIVNADHHTFLNNGNLKWGTTLLQGNMTSRKV